MRHFAEDSSTCESSREGGPLPCPSLYQRRVRRQAFDQSHTNYSILVSKIRCFCLRQSRPLIKRRKQSFIHGRRCTKRIQSGCRRTHSSDAERAGSNATRDVPVTVGRGHGFARLSRIAHQVRSMYSTSARARQGRKADSSADFLGRQDLGKRRGMSASMERGTDVTPRYAA